MKSKDRIINNLEKELQQVLTRLDTQQSEVTRSRVNLELFCRCRTDSERVSKVNIFNMRTPVYFVCINNFCNIAV